MHIEHLEKGLSYTNRDFLILARKIGKMATYCNIIKNDASVIRVEAERRQTKKEQDAVKVMITVELPHAVLRAESRRSLAMEAVDRCVEKLEPRLKKYKELHTRRGRANAENRRSARRKQGELAA